MSSKVTDILKFNPVRKIVKNQDAPFISMALLKENSKFINGLETREYKGGGAKFKNGDTLFARITPCLENGKTSLVTKLKPEEIGHGSTEFIVLSPINSTDTEYVYYLAQHPDFRQYAKSRMEGTSGRQRVSWQALAEFEFEFPNELIRKKIGRFLSLLDKKIEINNQINETLEAMAQAIFKSWFVDFDPVRAKAEAKAAGKDDTGILRAAMAMIASKSEQALAQMAQDSPDEYKKLEATAQAFPDAFVESELGLIPEGWEVKPLSEIIDIRDGTHDSPKSVDNGFPLVTSRHITSGKIELENANLISNEDYEKINQRSRVNTGDILLTMIGTTGIPCLVRDNPVLFAIKNVALYRTSETPLLTQYLYESLKSFEMQLRLDSLLAGTTQKYLSLRVLRGFPVILPKQTILEFFNKNIITFSSYQTMLFKENKILTELRDSLLPKLLSGEIEV